MPSRPQSGYQPNIPLLSALLSARTSVPAGAGWMCSVVRFASGSCGFSFVPYSSSETILERSNLTTDSIISTNVPSFNFPT
jgi:hypothetical protein